MTFHVGQLVVCVDDGPMRPSGRPSRLTARKIYRVLGILKPIGIGAPEWSVVVDGASSVNWFGDYCPSRFRPLNDAEDDHELIARIKQCKPARVPNRIPEKV